MVQNKTDENVVNGLRDFTIKRIKQFEKVIKGIEKNSFRFNYDGEQTYNDEVEYQSDLSRYEGMLGVLREILSHLPKPTKKAVVKLNYDFEGSGIIENTFCFKLDEETKTEVTYIYYVEDSYCNEETVTFEKSEIKENLKRFWDNDETKLNRLIEQMITESI